jgi:hypothetical protein
MRFVTTAAASLLALAACQKTEAPKPAPTSPTAAELGQDDPEVKFTPAPPGDAHKYAALSKTAMSITGDLSATPSPQVGPNSPPGMTFAFSKGMALTTTLMPGGATDGAKPYDWKIAFPSQRPLALDKIEMYSVETELPAPPAKAGSICDKTMFVATYLDDAGTPSAADDILMLAAFTSDDWPPSKPDTALCATYSYSPSTK